ncbi:MAG: phosphonate C-P lyase system protein PhnH [Coriobacteriales bacterium]|nr:phosphonate C-P lyase system protein PhnH [Coriobacteriales bacterium]
MVGHEQHDPAENHNNNHIFAIRINSFGGDTVVESSSVLHVTQQAFRATMNALARPGRLQQVPALAAPGFANPHLAALAVTLLDSTCGFAVASADDEAFSAAVGTQTYARPLGSGDFVEDVVGAATAATVATASAAPAPTAVVPAAQLAQSDTSQLRSALPAALFALITRDAQKDAASRLIAAVPGGTPASPERGATVLLECDALATDVGDVASHRFVLEGPGINGQQCFAASSSYWFFARGARDDEFPCGIDILLLDPAGRLVGLPRSSRAILGA